MSYQETLQLLAHCQAGDARSVETLVRAHQDTVYRLALSILDDPAEADEATQDTFITVLNTLSTYRGDAAFSTWLYTITLNICRGRLRKRKTRERLAQVLKTILPFSASHPEEIAIRRDSDAHLWQAIQALSEKLRLPIVLRYYHDLSTAEIATILDINENTVRTRLFNAREQLRNHLSRHFDQERIP